MEIIPNNIQAFSLENFCIDIKMHSMIDFESLHIDSDFFQLKQENVIRKEGGGREIPMDCCW